MEEVLMVRPQEMEKLIQYYKGELTENALLNKAARMSAKRDLLLRSNLPAGIIKARVKPLSREVHHLTKRVRRGPTGGLGGQLEDDDDDDDDALVTGPMEQVIKKLIKATPSKKGIKKEKEVKKEIKTPVGAKSSRGVITPVTPQLEQLRKRRETLEKRLEETAKKRRQTELERLKTIPGWTTWDRPVKRKLKGDF